LLDHQRGRPCPVAAKYALSPRLVDYEIAAVDHHTEGLLMAPSEAIHRLFARHGLRFDYIDLWEIHEAIAAQVPANAAAIERSDWIRSKTGVDADFGTVAISHPFATGV